MIREALAQVIGNPALPTALQQRTGGSFFAGLIPAIFGIGFIIGAVVFTVMLMVGGIQYISSGGDKMGIEKARARLTSAIIGLTILMSFFVVSNFIDCFFGVHVLSIRIGEYDIGFARAAFCTGGGVLPPPGGIPTVTPRPNTPTPTGGVSATNTPTPGPIIPPGCNNTCTTPSVCSPYGLTCSAGLCRNAGCTSQTDCNCSVAATCQQACAFRYPGYTNWQCANSVPPGWQIALEGEFYCSIRLFAGCWCAMPTATPVPASVMVDTSGATGTFSCTSFCQSRGYTGCPGNCAGVGLCSSYTSGLSYQAVYAGACFEVGGSWECSLMHSNVPGYSISCCCQ